MLAVERPHSLRERHSDPSHGVRHACLVSTDSGGLGGKVSGNSRSAEYVST